MKKQLLLLVAVCIAVSAFAQGKDYRQKADEVEQKIWGVKDPMFEVNTIPEKYKNESVVILAQKHTMESDSKFKFKFFSSGGKMSFYNTIREKVYINDKTALEQYSEMTFNKIEAKTSAVRGANKAYSFMGIRVIKPNGSIQKVSIDENAVILKEDGKNKQNKIAVPDLAVGDIVDYYICNFNTYDAGIGDAENLVFVFADDAPILNLNITLQFDKRLAAEYQCINGAPDFRVTPDADGNGNIMQISMQDLPKLKNILWSSVARQIPIARIRYKSSEITHKEGMPTAKGEVKKSTNNPEPIEADIKMVLVQSQLPIYRDDYVLKNMRAELEKTRKDLEKMKTPVSEDPDSLAAFAYYYARFYSFFNSNLNLTADYTDIDKGYTLYQQLLQALRMRSVFENYLKLKCDFITIPGRNSVSRANLFEVSDLSILLRVYTPKPVYVYLGNALYNYGELPTSFEGEQGAFFSIKPKKGAFGNVMDYKVEDEGLVTLPALTKEGHTETGTINVSVDPSNNQVLAVKRRVAATGQQRRYLQATLEVAEDMMVYERKYLGWETDVVTAYTDQGKAQRKSMDEMVAVLKKARDGQKERFENDIYNEYDVKAKELKSFKILRHGFHHTDPVFEMEEEFTMDGWVKKAGNNYIVEIGHFIGSQLEIKAEQRDRKMDLYMPHARSFTFNIDFTVPDGYSVEGLDKLNKNITNECGLFTSVAKLDGNKLTITVNKQYNKIVEPVANWTKVTAFVDAAFDFSKEKILLKKK